MIERIAQDGQGFDQLNGEGGGSFAWDTTIKAWRARTQGQITGQKQPFARGLIRTDDLREGDTVWAGVEYLIPAASYANMTKWQDGPLRGINWREYPGEKDNTGFSFVTEGPGADGSLRFSSWRDKMGARTHGGAPRPTPDIWHTIETCQTFSQAAPFNQLYVDGQKVTLPGVSFANYDWSRPFVLNDWQFGLVGTSGNPAPLEMLVRRAYVGPRRVFGQTPEPEPADTFTLAQVMALQRGDIAYWRAKRQSWASVKGSPGGQFYYGHGGK